MFALGEQPDLAEDGKTCELTRGHGLDHTHGARLEHGLEPGTFLRELQTRKQAPDFGHPFLDDRVLLDEPMVLLSAESDRLGWAVGHHVGPAERPLLSNPPFTEGVGLPERGDDATAVAHAHPSIRDDLKVNGFPRDPDDEVGEVAVGVEAVAGAQRRDTEPRPVAGELNALQELSRNPPREPWRCGHFELFLGRPAVRLNERHVEATSAACDSLLRRRQTDDGRRTIERDEVHVIVDPEYRAFRVAVPAGSVKLMSGAQEVVRVSRADAVCLGELLEGRWLRHPRVEEPEECQGEQPMQDLALPRRANDPRARLLAQEEVQVDEELDVGVVRLSLEEARRQDEQMVALEAFAQDVLRRARHAAELDAGGAIGAE